MQRVLEHNRDWFYSQDFIKSVHTELIDNFTQACDELQHRTALKNQHP